MDRFTLTFLTFSFICSRLRVKFINPPKFPSVIEINVRRPSNRTFCTPSVSSIAGPFTNSPLQTSRTVLVFQRSILLRLLRGILSSDIEKVKGIFPPRRTRSIRLLALPTCCQSGQSLLLPSCSVSRKLPGSSGTLCSRTRLISLQHSRVKELDFHFIQSLLEDSVQPGFSFNAIKVDSIGG